MACPISGIKDFLIWAPVIDGEVVTAEPLAQMAGVGGGELNVPLILGTNENEGLLFVETAKAAMNKKSLSALDYRLTVDFMFSDHEIRKRIYEKYPQHKGDNTAVSSRVITDSLFTCPTLYAAKYSSPDTWSYRFDQVSSFNVWPGTPACADTVCHGDELAYVFHTARNRGYSFTPAERELSDLMVGYWTNFAKHLNPNGDTVNWLPFGKNSLSLIFVAPADGLRAKSDPEADCSFWDETGYDLRGSFWGMF